MVMDAKKHICLPESFNTNIYYQFLDCKITFVNSQQSHPIASFAGLK